LATSTRMAAADAVYDGLRAAITGGQLEPNSPLVEEQLARQFGVSRTPVREALLRLESEGVALRVPRRGLVVRALSEHEVREVYAVRAALEALAGRWAASEALPSDIAHLRWINQRLREAMSAGDTSRIPLLTNEFHQALGAAAHNGMLSRFIMQCQDWTRRVGTSTVALPARTASAVDEHERLIDAIEAGDAEAAERLAREHISTGRQFQLAVLRERHRLQP
jgi:DNA-binding GntR family transcriptional regulator